MPEDTQESTQETLQRIHENVHSINPFKERDDHGPRSILAYRVFTALTWLLVVITSIYYTFAKPHEGQGPWHTIWGQNKAHHTAFTLNSIIVSIYWITLFILQIGYSYHLYNREPEYVSAACNVGSHFIFHNLLLFAFIMLWTRGYLWIAELIVVVNFINLSAAYFLHNKGPRIIHIATVSGPLAWNFVALYWCGAAMVNAHTLPARIVANIFVWSILAYGMFFLAAYRDYTMGFALSVLSAALGVAQFVRQIVAFQWIFAFVIMAVLFVISASVMGAVLSGRDPFKPQESAAEDDRERAPLLAQD